MSVQPYVPPETRVPRMLAWVAASLLLIITARFAQDLAPGSILAVSLYKAHLLALGGWGGYWLDRALFPYDRPHQHVLPAGERVWIEPDTADPAGSNAPIEAELATSEADSFGLAMSSLRRAIVVAACLVCVGLGA